MKDFFDEFIGAIAPIKPDTPIQYVKLDDAYITKRDLDTFPDFLKDKALDKYKLISLIEKKHKWLDSKKTRSNS